MFGLAKRERFLYERLIENLEEQLATIRAQLGIHSYKVDESKIPPTEKQAHQVPHPTTEYQEDLEWQFEMGQIDLEEYTKLLNDLGFPAPKVKFLEGD